MTARVNSIRPKAKVVEEKESLVKDIGMAAT